MVSINRKSKSGTLRNSAKGRHDLDCAFFNFLVELLKKESYEVGAIRAAVGEGEPMLPGSPIRLKSLVQIAILNPALITKQVVTPENARKIWKNHLDTVTDEEFVLELFAALPPDSGITLEDLRKPATEKSSTKSPPTASTANKRSTAAAPRKHSEATG